MRSAANLWTEVYVHLVIYKSGKCRYIRVRSDSMAECLSTGNSHQNRPDFNVFLLFSRKRTGSPTMAPCTRLCVAGFFKTSYRIPRTLKETTRISSQRSLWLAFLKGCRCLWTARNRQEFEPFETVDSASIDSDGLLCSPPLFFSTFPRFQKVCLFLATNSLQFRATSPLCLSGSVSVADCLAQSRLSFL